MFNNFREKEKGNRNDKSDANARPGAITAQSIYIYKQLRGSAVSASGLARRKENFGKEENSHAFVRASATPGILYSLRDLLRVARGNQSVARNKGFRWKEYYLYLTIIAIIVSTYLIIFFISKKLYENCPRARWCAQGAVSFVCHDAERDTRDSSSSRDGSSSGGGGIVQPLQSARSTYYAGCNASSPTGTSSRLLRCRAALFFVVIAVHTRAGCTYTYVSLFIPRVRTNAVCSCMYLCPSTYTYIIWRIYVKIYTYRALRTRRCAAAAGAGAGAAAGAASGRQRGQLWWPRCIVVYGIELILQKSERRARLKSPSSMWHVTKHIDGSSSSSDNTNTLLVSPCKVYNTRTLWALNLLQCSAARSSTGTASQSMCVARALAPLSASAANIDWQSEYIRQVHQEVINCSSTKRRERVWSSARRVQGCTLEIYYEAKGSKITSRPCSNSSSNGREYIEKWPVQLPLNRQVSSRKGQKGARSCTLLCTWTRRRRAKQSARRISRQQLVDPTSDTYIYIYYYSVHADVCLYSLCIGSYTAGAKAAAGGGSSSLLFPSNTCAERATAQPVAGSENIEYFLVFALVLVEDTCVRRGK
ncbi:unnamed protein product [Trichogramma brassicae]|uniref:Uncharacterized protein n=1 Tax=Trichogramma brassicae TaxID=86971 RepID=A0A6H5I6E6_9HYME|nr:unnamed protein product [Trichogramma brassicae]